MSHIKLNVRGLVTIVRVKLPHQVEEKSKTTKDQMQAKEREQKKFIKVTRVRMREDKYSSFQQGYQLPLKIRRQNSVVRGQLPSNIHVSFLFFLN